MAKIVKKTYGKKLAWETGSSHAFDQAKLQSKKASSTSKIIRPSIWAKVPLIESISESPPRPKKKIMALSPSQPISVVENENFTPKKGKKRKVEDPFGFGDLDEEVVPASEYISPKKMKLVKGVSPKKGSPDKSKKTSITNSKINRKDKTAAKNSTTNSKSPILSPVSSPKGRGRPPKDKILESPSPKKAAIKSKDKGKGPAISANDASPKKRGRPPKDKNTPQKENGSMENRNASSRNPGRPPKDKEAISKSPKGTFVKAKKQTISPVKTVNAISPKKRGRPPKDKMVEVVSPKKRGRPPKDKSVEISSPKKRGRPPKDKALMEPSPLVKRNTLKLKENNEFKKSSGAGRDFEEFASTTENNSKSPRPAGRPWKEKEILHDKDKLNSPENSSTIQQVDTASSSGSSQSIKDIIDIAPLLKRKPGRPPKNSRNNTKLNKGTPTAQVPNELAVSPATETSSDDIKSEENTDTLSSAQESLRSTPSLLLGVSLDGSESLAVNGSDSASLESPKVIRKRGRKPKDARVDRKVDIETLPMQEVSQTSSTLSDESESHFQCLSSSQAENPVEENVDKAPSRKVRFSSDGKSQDDSGAASGRESISSATGSPFKWFLKNNKKTLSPRKVQQLRRISVLPTFTAHGDDEDEIHSDVIPFSLPWGMDEDDNVVKVNKDEKELFTIVRNTKQAQESVEFGESQQFKDDIEYLLDGIADTNSLSTRCLSLIELASKCSKTVFRMNLRAHGTIAAIFGKLSDAPTNQHLALCTAAVMFMLTRDRLSFDFDKSILEMMLKLLAIEENADEQSSKEWNRLTSKLRNIFEKDLIQGVNNLDLSKLTTESLARESFLSLTLQRTGSWFKDEIRLLGGLDHIVDTVVSCSKCLKISGKPSSADSTTSVRQIERCLKLLENITVQCPTNQGYLVSYRDSALLQTCARLLKFSVASLFENDSEGINAVQALWFSTMNMLLNLTHDNELASTRICLHKDVLSILLKSALQLPAFLPTPKQFDVAVLSLGLIINLVEYSKKNLSALNAAVAPSFQNGSPLESESTCHSDDVSAVDSLLQLFLVKLEAAKENNGMEEDLAKLNDSLHNSSIRIGSDGLSLICGDDLDKTQNEDATTEESAIESTMEEKTVTAESSSDEKSKKTSAENKAEHLGKALEKAGQHMEDSLIASYAALLLALLAEDNKENQQIIHERLQYGDFGIMTHTLEKFLAFMNMTANTSNSSSSLVIKRAIQILEQCKMEHPPRPSVS